jgi:hypothetical protein
VKLDQYIKNKKYLLEWEKKKSKEDRIIYTGEIIRFDDKKIRIMLLKSSADHKFLIIFWRQKFFWGNLGLDKEYNKKLCGG